jgi:hypothetical protein
MLKCSILLFCSNSFWCILDSKIVYVKYISSWGVDVVPEANRTGMKPPLTSLLFHIWASVYCFIRGSCPMIVLEVARIWASRISRTMLTCYMYSFLLLMTSWIGSQYNSVKSLTELSKNLASILHIFSGPCMYPLPWLETIMCASHKPHFLHFWVVTCYQHGWCFSLESIRLLLLKRPTIIF